MIAEKNRIVKEPTPKKRINNDKAALVAELAVLPIFKPDVIEIRVKGITPLITNNFGSKAIRMMLDKQTKEATKGHDKKNPFEDFKGSLYPVMVDGKQRYGVSAPAFKACAVSAANTIQLKMTLMKIAFHVTAYTVPVDAPPLKEYVTAEDKQYAKELEPYHALGISMRMDVVRNQTGVCDLRFRGWFPVWSTKLMVEYDPTVISLPQLLNLFRKGGWGCGIGEWRPSAPECRSGESGRFELDMNLPS